MAIFDFAGKSVLVTGASSGIGYAIAGSFVASGAEVSILANNDEIYEAASQLTNDKNNPVIPIKCDISAREQVAKALGCLAHIDVLINNAGYERVTPIDEPGTDVEAAFRQIMAVNVEGSYYVTRDALPLMSDGSRIIFTASTWSKSAIARMSGYCASKHAVLGLVRSLARELGSRRITVNAICPGWVKTEQSFRSIINIAEQTGRTVEDISADLLKTQAIDGHLLPEDIVGGYLFLASDLARDITGQSLNIDRGELMI